MSRCSVKITSFWVAKASTVAIGRTVWHTSLAAEAPVVPRVKISPRRLASSRHFVSAPLRRTPSARASSCFRVSISAFSSAIVRAAVAWSRICSSTTCTSFSGASSKSSTSSSSSSRRSGDGCAGLPATLQELQLSQSALKPLTTTTKRLIYRLRRRRQPTLQNSESKSDRSSTLVVLERLGTVELFRTYSVTAL